MSKMIQQMFLPILINMVKAMTPALRTTFFNFLQDLRKQAAKTDNPFDDLAVDILIGLFEGQV